ncbi:hypothetical protein LTR28_005569 [Elasticomyces elasticus]|nr:hypothetical protein LTR28_005569 [Elasticomyces elasticus]
MCGARGASESASRADERQVRRQVNNQQEGCAPPRARGAGKRSWERPQAAAAGASTRKRKIKLPKLFPPKRHGARRMIRIHWVRKDEGGTGRVKSIWRQRLEKEGVTSHAPAPALRGAGPATPAPRPRMIVIFGTKWDRRGGEGRGKLQRAP